MILLLFLLYSLVWCIFLSQGFPRAAAPVGVFSRGTTRLSGSLSCGRPPHPFPPAPRGLPPHGRWVGVLPRSKRLLISWLQSPSVVILEPRKIKSDTVSTVSPSISHEVMGPSSGGLRPLVELCVEPAGLCGRCTGVAVPLRVDNLARPEVH